MVYVSSTLYNSVDQTSQDLIDSYGLNIIIPEFYEGNNSNRPSQAVSKVARCCALFVCLFVCRVQTTRDTSDT